LIGAAARRVPPRWVCQVRARRSWSGRRTNRKSGRGNGGGGRGRGALVNASAASHAEIRALVQTVPTDTSTSTRNWRGMFDERFKDGSTLQAPDVQSRHERDEGNLTNDSLPPNPQQTQIGPNTSAGSAT